MITENCSKLSPSLKARVTLEPGPYILVRDGDCHRYVIPKARAAEWEVWADLPGDDERAWTPPAYAEAVDGQVVFPSYEIQ